MKKTKSKEIVNNSENNYGKEEKGKEKNIVLFVAALPVDVTSSIREHEKQTGEKFRIMLLWDSAVKDVKDAMNDPNLDIVEICDFSDDSLMETLLPYQDELLCVVARSESAQARLSKVIPHVPYLHTPTSESLKWATDKYKMRKRMYLFDPKITPRFTKVNNNSKKERERVIAEVKFPMIIKPASLSMSRFVTICYHREELEKNLRAIFKNIKKAYHNDSRKEEPIVIAEEYMEGEMYSIDSYVDSKGKIWHCPLVKVTTGKDIGHDDFFNYLVLTPTLLKPATVKKAEVVAEKLIKALALRNVTTHTELMKIDDEWKVIELGPRVGGFRSEAYKLSCGINHDVNDIYIRMNKTPMIPEECEGFAAVLKFYADKEGIITEFKGIKKIKELESFHQVNINKKIGDRAVFARNGGKAIFVLYLYNKDRSKLLADIRRAETLVNVKVTSRSDARKKKLMNTLIDKVGKVKKVGLSKKNKTIEVDSGKQTKGKQKIDKPSSNVNFKKPNKATDKKTK